MEEENTERRKVTITCNDMICTVEKTSFKKKNNFKQFSRNRQLQGGQSQN